MSTYHGAHEYSTFSSSTIPSKKWNNDYSNKCMKILCFPCRLSSTVFHPFGPFRCIWDLIVMLLLIYTLIEIPFTISFGLKKTIRNIGLCVDIMLFIDIFLNFSTAYFDKWDNLRLVTNRKFIYKKYLRTWFIIDFVTCIPFEFINYNSNITESNQNVLIYIKILRVCRLLRIVKIFRFLKMVRIYNGFMKQFVIREVLIAMKLVKMICGMLIFAHFAACLWWYVGIHTQPSWVDKWGLRTNDHSAFTKYTFSWYWAVVTLFTTGYGDIVPINVTEKWISSICILIGTCFFAYFVGTLTVLITEGDRIKSYERDKLEEAQSFCERKKLPKELTHAILTHIRYHFSYNYVFDESDVLALLPSYLQHDINVYVSKQFLLQLKIFQNEYINLPEFIIGLIALKTKSISCNQSYKLFDVDDMAKEFYIQRTGKSILMDKNDKLIHELSRGNVCGEYASFLFKRHITKVECQTWCEFYSISIDDIRQILDTYYPKSSHLKWERFKKYLKHSFNKDVKHYVQFTQTEHEDIFNPSVSLRSSDMNNILNASKNHSKSPHRTPAMPPYDESIHLFQVKSNKNETSEKQTTLRSSLGPSHAIPPIIESDYDDREELEEKINIQNKTKKKTSYNKFAKFKVRSNSALRNKLVVAHGEKHNKSLVESTAPLKPKLTKSKTEPVIIPEKTNMNMKAALEMSMIQTNVLKTSASHRSVGPSMPAESPDSLYHNRNANDSECSLSSLTDFSTDEDMNDENVQTNKTMHMVKKKVHTKHKPVKKKRKKFKNAQIARGKRTSMNFSPKVYAPNIKVISNMSPDERLKPSVIIGGMNKTSSQDSVFAAMSQTSGHSSGIIDVITTADNTEDDEEDVVASNNTSNNSNSQQLNVVNDGSHVVEVEEAHLFMSTLKSNREHLYDENQAENVEEHNDKVT